MAAPMRWASTCKMLASSAAGVPSLAASREPWDCPCCCSGYCCCAVVHGDAGVAGLRTIVSLLALLVLTPPAQAQAQVQGFSVLRMRPAASPLNLYNTERGQTLPHLSPSVGFYMHYDGKPLQMVDANNQPLFNEVEHQFNMSLLAAFGLWDRAEIGVALPVTFTQDAGDRDPGRSRSALAVRRRR